MRLRLSAISIDGLSGIFSVNWKNAKECLSTICRHDIILSFVV